MNSGWSKNSKMHLRYIHWFNNQGSNAVLKAEGFISDEELAPLNAAIKQLNHNNDVSACNLLNGIFRSSGSKGN
jgi:hypothetical protein